MFCKMVVRAGWFADRSALRVCKSGSFSLLEINTLGSTMTTQGCLVIEKALESSCTRLT